ncbi:DUF956 family protein [Sporolactobacillus sp. CPB3-1]|uniref:DUF956 family protein n=1 Tax=Sporolactobacillus mangiferae TaxID=2940498 RepID=A0ABT0M776_9BACL|nr:DUF956 family protein [Sporolactobacillus mangiferae]MCL1630712.1 DUF956 family protein [Sporolactobacillus mangiferae]
MVQSMNTKVDFVTDATSFMGLTDYGKIMIGDKGFEFYNDRNIRKYIRIPWDEIDYVVASVIFKGKWIPRYAIRTKKNGTYTFSSRHPKEVLRAIRKYVHPERMVRSLTFFQVVKRGLKAMFSQKRRN